MARTLRGARHGGATATAAMNATDKRVSGLAETARGRCPHLLYRDVMGAETVAALLGYVAARERDFTAATVRNRQSGPRIDRAVRDCCYLSELAAFEPAIRSRIEKLAVEALPRLGLSEPAVKPREFEICAYADGGHFVPHIDTFETLNKVRVLSCVYYFATTPRRFGGGILRLHGFPTVSGDGAAAPGTVDIAPETDSLVMFPSWLRHEVLPVAVPSGDWLDSRFSINCWLHRASPSADAAAPAR